MRVLFAVLIVAEICFIAAPFLASSINRPEAARAWQEWQQKPSPETEEAWKVESARLMHIRLVADSILIALLAINTIGLVKVGRIVFPKSKAKDQCTNVD